MTLGERITLSRKQAGLSQEQLGDRLGVSRQAVSKWESDQTNPDVSYVAQMCRLLEVSSDWLLLGEESAHSAPPARCPGCQAVVSGLDRYCPSCGRSLQGKQEGYTILLKTLKPGTCSPVRDLVCLSNTGLFPRDSPLYKPLSQAEAEEMAASAPQVLARGLTREQLLSAWNDVIYAHCFLFFQDSEEEDPQVLAGYPGINPESLIVEKRREPMSFGMTALAVIVGIVGAVIILMFL